MSKHQTIPATAADPTVAAGAAQFLTPVTLGLQALAVNGKQAHWNVRGANFIAIHELLDTVVDHAQEYADLAAERIVALGLPVDARLSTVAEKTLPSTVPAGFTQWDEMIRHIVAWKLKSEDPLERSAQAQKLSSDLNALKGVVPSIIDIAVGPDVVGGGNWDVALVADFADQAALDAYQTHPDHQAVVGYVRSVVADRVAVDYEV
jgi:starvation-inducible DNA-binding protein